ncbi:alpha/beta-hydrolase [Patellaria atrata CBS 101060]|uniref:Alpha/beta-hydrolase n=1 Tax=Patellaria atrata CBS 101060 TaxID=1346257 RepID=A0A9P4SGW2_9PEZI|nr:alpha/beta-hydrolase [Patellaria atrata CBS 101060]
MRYLLLLISIFLSLGSVAVGLPRDQEQGPLPSHITTGNGNITDTISVEFFNELEELARIVDIAYCIGVTGTGISKPFECANRCDEFEHFELVKAWNTGPFLSDSCGYIALSHSPSSPRVIVAFRGTYSLANTIADLSTVPQEYVPYPGDEDDDAPSSNADSITNPPSQPSKCTNCTVHTGFHTSWLNTRAEILPILLSTLMSHPTYNLILVGHSLGGAVASLAALDLLARGFDPKITTFGEPRVGNLAFTQYVDARFNLTNSTSTAPQDLKYRRVTHNADPVPMLPLSEWGYRMHAGEIYITKSPLPPEREDIHVCDGDEDPTCIANGDTTGGIPIPTRYKLWQLFFAHRDYFWRLGLCIPGGDPWDWWRGGGGKEGQVEQDIVAGIEEGTMEL